MRNTVKNIYTILPFNNDIKFVIYTQMYKHLNKLPNNFKEDLQTYLMLNYVIEKYRKNLQTDYMDNYFLYSLYNDLLFENHVQQLEKDKDEDILFYNFCYESVLIESNSLQIYNNYPILIQRIKYFWKILSSNRRKNFIIFVNIKYY